MFLLRRATGLLRVCCGSAAPAFATCGAMLSACIAVTGYALLAFLFLTRYYLPASHYYVRPLHFDYTGYVAEAVTSLSPNLREQSPMVSNKPLTSTAVALLPKSRFLPSGSQVSVHVQLVIPSHHHDLFQVTGELLSNGSHTAARSARTHINTPQPYAYRMARQLFWLPLHVLGLGHGNWARVDLPLFDEYEEVEDAPVDTFRARLASRNSSMGALPPPPVHQAEVHVRLKLGWFKSMLFWLRPGLATSVLLLLAGLTMSMGGTTAALGLTVLVCMLRRWATAGTGKGYGKGDGGYGDAWPIAAAQQQRRKHTHNGGPPYGNRDDALSYSLANAAYFRGGGNGNGAAADEDSQPYYHHPHGEAHRQGSGFSQTHPVDSTLVGDEESTFAHDAVPRRLTHEGSPAWSGSTESNAYTPVGGAAGGYPGGKGSFSRQSTGTAAAASSGRAAAVNGETPQPAATAAKAPSAEDELDVDVPASAKRRDDVNASEEGGWERHEHRSVEEGHEEEGGEDDIEGSDAGASEEGHGGEEDEEAEGDYTEDEGPAGEQEARGHRDAGKAAALAAEGAAEGQRGDLDPQADNEGPGGAVRRRSAFAWQA
ncbi:hypothetical protein Agub_g3533 [Astrephomene gubernaculifera]|uniref:Seipin n=1 Tax=Astrephomene gubernaculifera TaxID=47775 RepID=A0AAD3DKU3_9CHLO|nr:hypothetical protein Agub_g3533 [Astrephomene gubernaculifera]